MSDKHEEIVQKYLSRYIDGELSPEELEEFETSLEQCSQPEEWIEEQRTMTTHLNETFDQLESRESVMERLLRFIHSLPEIAARKRLRSFLPSAVWPSPIRIAAGLIVVFIIVGAVIVPNFQNAQIRSSASRPESSSPQFFQGQRRFSHGADLQTNGYSAGESIPGLRPLVAGEQYDMSGSYGMMEGVEARQESESDQDYRITDHRKVIRNGWMTLVVENVTKVREEVERIVEEYKGLVANAKVNESETVPWAKMTLWVPAEDLDTILDKFSGLGKTQQIEVSAQDITDQYFDLETRVRNLKRQEERLLSLYEREVEKLDEILKVEQEIQRVRSQIEQLEGRQRLWDRQISLSTIELTISQKPEQEPIAVSEPDDVFSPLRRVFRDAKAVFLQSCSIITSILAWIVSTFIFLAPWFVITIIVWFAGKGILYLRRTK